MSRVVQRQPGRTARFLHGDLAQGFSQSPLAVVAFLVFILCAAGAILAPWVAPFDPYDLASLDLMDSLKPPVFSAGGEGAHPLGTDDQGRDILSGVLYGMRLSLGVSVSAVCLSAVVGVAAGLASGYLGGFVDALLMRTADIQLTFPAILVALLVDGVVRVALPRNLHDTLQVYVVIIAIGISCWPQFARTVRASTMVESGKEYVLAARLVGVTSARIALTHILPNVVGPVVVLGTTNLGVAIIAEATLSFLGMGLPPTQPSLGTLIRIGNDFLFSGEWWMTVFPGAALVLLVLAINLLGDWLREALDPRLR